ncbi:carbohydrate kinase [Gonapodya prolifera JEL478]|uniref:Gluconokinase n=1 Tax=Gonapodya prolifera (strain JEL478) TaxID=1344416 RepID=A0A139AC30_GONPJ|nr:carbohydrate kinase [Gonapodya prolifera JEL478]|eukprot:KXS14219.1 carbohydrate kinase [Gonapodya prolifera JEL478]
MESATISVIFVMGVAGCGKSTVMEHLHQKLSDELLSAPVASIEGDKLHPQANIDKMARGIPLTDDDRWPWLAEIRSDVAKQGLQLLREHSGASTARVLVTCSSLKRAYRAFLADESTYRSTIASLTSIATPSRVASVSVTFAFLNTPREVLEHRISSRPGHFMKAGMLESQMNTLEVPTSEEGVEGGYKVLNVDASQPLDAIVEQIAHGKT